MDGKTLIRYNGETLGDTFDYDQGVERDARNLQKLSPQQLWMKEAATALTSRQAEVVDLRYNKGLSMKKIAEITGTIPSSASGAHVGAMNFITYWCSVKAAVQDCKDNSFGFDFELFFEKIPNAFPYRCKVTLLYMLRSGKNYATIASLQRDMGNISEVSVRKALPRIKMYCKGYGIPLRSLPMLVRKSKDLSFDQATLIRGSYSFAKKGDKGYRSEGSVFPSVPDRSKQISPYHKFPSFNDAVFASLQEMGFAKMTDDMRKWLGEAEELLSEKDRIIVRRVFDNKESTMAVGEDLDMRMLYVEKHIRNAISFVATQVCLMYDAKRIFSRKESGWVEFLKYWRIFTKKQSPVVDLLISSPDISKREIIHKMGIDACFLDNTLAAIKVRCDYLNVPGHQVFALVRAGGFAIRQGSTNKLYIATHTEHLKKRKSG